MQKTLSLNGSRWLRVLSFFSGIGMMAASLLTINHYFLANFPESIFEGSFCDISTFFNCDSSAFSAISQVMGIPIGYFGLIIGGLVALGALFPSDGFEHTNTFIALVNVLGVLSLFFYAVFGLHSLCLLCSGYYIFSILSFILFWRFGIGKGEKRFPGRFFRPSIKMLITFACITLFGAYGMINYRTAREKVRESVAVKIVKQFYELPEVNAPSFLSPFWTVRSTEYFEDAPIHLIEFSDFLCPDCLFFTQQLNKLKEEFAGKMNIAFQFFPLEAGCNTVVEKDLHPGACELAYIAAYDPSKFVAIHDELFANFNAARDPEWRRELAVRYGVEDALTDSATKDMISTIVQTGIEYEKTSDVYAHGIRSTPTIIINGRMIIGTLPYEHLRAIFQALIAESEGGKKFLENWVPAKVRRKQR